MIARLSWRDLGNLFYDKDQIISYSGKISLFLRCSLPKILCSNVFEYTLFILKHIDSILKDFGHRLDATETSQKIQMLFLFFCKNKI